MDLTLIISDPLAESLRQLALQRGISVEALGQEVITAGLLAVAPASDNDQEPLDLGSLTLPITRTLRLHSPILARGPIPKYTIEILSPPAAGSGDTEERTLSHSRS